MVDNEQQPGPEHNADSEEAHLYLPIQAVWTEGEGSQAARSAVRRPRRPFYLTIGRRTFLFYIAKEL